MTSEALSALAGRSNFFSKPVSEQVQILTWFLHENGKERVVTGDLRQCYHDLHLEPPNISRYLSYQSDGKSKRFIRDRKGFRLEGKTRRIYDEAYLEQAEAVAVRKLLTDLIPKIPNEHERTFLEEALRCYRAKAFRATVVMAWNLAFSHLVSYITGSSEIIQKLNAGASKRYPKSKITISTSADVEEMKEFEVIECAYTAKLISKNITEILREKLKKRNMAAHPSSVTISQAQTDDVVTDLIENVVLRL